MNFEASTVLFEDVLCDGHTKRPLLAFKKSKFVGDVISMGHVIVVRSWSGRDKGARHIEVHLFREKPVCVLYDRLDDCHHVDRSGGCYFCQCSFMLRPQQVRTQDNGYIAGSHLVHIAVVTELG